MPIRWNAGASLHRAGVTQHEPGQYAILWTDEVWDGTLCGALRQWSQKADTLKPLYSIFVRHQAGTKKTILDYRDMEDLLKQPDFPAQ